MKHFRVRILDLICSRAFKRTRILGYACLGLMLLAFYVEFVNIANTVGPLDSVESLSLSDSRGGATLVFGMGDLLTLSARVRRGNAYALDIYDVSLGLLAFAKWGGYI